MITKQHAVEILKENIHNENLRKHHYAVAAAMRGLALELGGDPEMWEIVGLLHDADYEKTKDTPEQHTLVLSEILRDEGVEEEIIRAIQSHNYEHTELHPETNMEFALLSCDDLTGLIVAVALVHPNKLSDVSVESVMKKFHSKSFATGADREKIQRCETTLDLPLETFVNLVLEVMKEEAEVLGL
jgi:putative nucleotidyltransferase with HDIG domain